MKPARIVLIGVFLFCSLALSAQIRNSVMIVKPKLSEEGIKAYRKIAAYFRSRTYHDLAAYFDSRTESNWGSGFLWVDRFNRTVIVTNRHVVTFANSAAVILLDESGKELASEDCPVIYEAPDLDCALLLPRGGVFEGRAGLEFAETVPAEGETVFSAGFPALMEKPSWQFAKGIVTNRRVYVESLGSPEHAVFTQHSAPIDIGSSGGPLLIADPDDPSLFRVAGINTWVMLHRQNANFAISLEVLKPALEQVPGPVEALTPSEAVRAKAGELAASLNADEWRCFESARYISGKMVMSSGWDAFESIVSTAKEEVREEWAERFFSESPEETLRQALYYKIYNALHKKNASLALVSVDEVMGSGGRHVRTGLSAGSRVYYLDWFEELGNWRIRAAGISSAGLSSPRKLS